MGTLADAHFAGNFAPVGAAVASGFDKLGVYGKFGNSFSFLFDTTMMASATRHRDAGWLSSYRHPVCW